ncbi:S8 family serine peptidase [Nocardia sp. NPDC050710]|uniref:S8 family serine peptidase n=1 Tax=Nocardia sp. NPDC050710 TaxID=3157220 RepID=UPI0033F3E7F1
MDSADLQPIADRTIEQSGHVVIFDADETELPQLSESGLFIQNVTQSPATTPQLLPPSTDRMLAPPPAEPELAGLELEPFEVPEPETPEPTSANVYIIDMDGPLTSDRITAFTDLGCVLLERIGRMSATMRVPPGSVSALDDLPGVLGHRLYTATDTLHAALIAPPSALESITFDALAHEPADVEVIEQWLSQRGVLVVAKSVRKVRFAAIRNDTRIAQLAALPEVRQIDEYLEPELSNDVARKILGVDNPAGPAGTVTVPWTGAGQVVAVADSGIDETHPDLSGRITHRFALGRPGDTSDPVGHGTHVAGSIAGNGPSVKGVAPAATLIVQSLSRSNGKLNLPLDLGNLFEQAHRAGAHIHNNSWGALARSAYRMSALELDEWAWHHPEMLIVVAAGNNANAAANINAATGFVDLLSIDAPATAKNALTVGASRTPRAVRGPNWRVFKPAAFPDDPIGSENVAGDPECLAAFSGRGPCDEQLRLKPDVVAPGTYILSTRSSTAPDSAFWLEHDTRYAYMGGTSMATPLVSGIAALVREYYVSDRGHENPSAALLKATIVGGARWLTGSDATADHPTEPNYHQGFGCVDLTTSLPIRNRVGSPPTLEFVDTMLKPSEQLAQTGSERKYMLRVRQAGLRLCLAWTDPPGRGVQNSLALTLRHTSGHQWAGNERRPSTGLRMVDSGNNVQVIRIDDAPAGTYQLQVTATNLLRGPQAFALVVTGDLTSPLRLQP